LIKSGWKRKDMDYEEEQSLELEALEAIFVDDYELLETSPRKVRVTLEPFPGQPDESHVAVSVEFVLPKTYPEVVPEISVQPIKGLIPKHCEELKASGDECANENLGMPMIFTITEVIKDWLCENNRDHTDQSMHAQMMMRIEAEENKKLAEKQAEEQAAKEVDDEEEDGVQKPIDGTPVTIESFTAWLNKFIEEEELEKAKLRETTSTERNPAPDAHLTGREIFDLKEKSKVVASAATTTNENDEWDKEIEEELFLEDDDELDDLDDLDDSSDDE